MDRTTFILALLSLPRVGRKTVQKILLTLKNMPTDIVDLSEFVASSNIVEVSPSAAKVAVSSAQAAMDSARDAGVTVVATGDSGFPPQLEEISDSPVLLFVKGNFHCLNEPDPVAIVGTRNPSDFGLRCAERFGRRCAESNVVVISGLAKGCDAAAHEGCVNGNGKTVAVLAHGLDRIYPKENQGLAERILEKGGCWVSEYPLGARAQRSYFVERDRIQSGLSCAVIVVETDVDGGTMHTVGFAESQGRLVACLAVDDASAPVAAGNRMLIETGRGRPLRDATDFNTLLADARSRVAHSG